MDLYEEILLKNLKENFDLKLPILVGGTADFIEMTCYDALKKIKAVIEDDRLDDKECFSKVEEIICVFEELGSNGGNRHDF